MATTASRLLLLAAILATIGCDRVTKRWAAEALSDGTRHSYLGDTVRLDYAENTGAFLSLGADWPAPVRRAVFVIVAGVTLVAFAAIAATSAWPPIAVLGVGLIVAGGASNVADRLAFGAVVDFLNVGIGPLRTGIFNVADVAITAGAILALFGFRARPAANGL